MGLIMDFRGVLRCLLLLTLAVSTVCSVFTLYAFKYLKLMQLDLETSYP